MWQVENPCLAVWCGITCDSDYGELENVLVLKAELANVKL